MSLKQIVESAALLLQISGSTFQDTKSNKRGLGDKLALKSPPSRIIERSGVSWIAVSSFFQTRRLLSRSFPFPQQRLRSWHADTRRGNPIVAQVLLGPVGVCQKLFLATEPYQSLARCANGNHLLPGAFRSAVCKSPVSFHPFTLLDQWVS